MKNIWVSMLVGFAVGLVLPDKLALWIIVALLVALAVFILTAPWVAVRKHRKPVQARNGL